MNAVVKDGKPGFSVMEEEDIQRFHPIEGIALPEGTAYLLTDIDAGKETLNVTPNEALKRIAEEQRSPLTIEEGNALITHFCLGH